MIPIASHLDGDRFRIFFSSRDKKNRGHGGFVEIELKNPEKILRISEKPVLVPGDLGCFDDSGALPNAIVDVDGVKYLYYTGINLGVTVKIRNSIGLAKWNEQTESFEKMFKGPVIDRTKDQPHFVATPEVIHENGKFKAWFTSCVRWDPGETESKHFYNIEYAESLDGITWNRTGNRAIDFRDEFEYAQGVPRVIRDSDKYRMWFCSRATKQTAKYRMSYAESVDGYKWNRQDDKAGIDVSASGWDSEMVCYPYVFDHKGLRYMLYNGNDYGRTGFGLAVLD